MFAFALDDDLRLEPADPRFADAFFALVDANRAHLRRWHPWVDATRSPDDSQRALASMRRQYADNGNFHTLIRERNALVGIVGFNAIDWSNRYGVLGYWLAADAQGRGIMTRACRACIDHAFGALGLNRVEIRCALDNVRSRAVAQRLGFTLEGVLRDREWLYDHFVDHAIYALKTPHA